MYQCCNCNCESKVDQLPENQKPRLAGMSLYNRAVLQELHRWIISDLANLIAQYAAEDTYHLVRVNIFSKSRFITTLRINRRFARIYKRTFGKDLTSRGFLYSWVHPMSHLFEQGTLEEIRPIEENYQRFLLNLQDRDRLPKSLFTLVCYDDQRYISPLVEILENGQNTESDIRRLYAILHYVLECDSRFANMGYFSGSLFLIGFKSIVQLVRKFGPDNPLSNLLEMYYPH